MNATALSDVDVLRQVLQHHPHVADGILVDTVCQLAGLRGQGAGAQGRRPGGGLFREVTGARGRSA